MLAKEGCRLCGAGPVEGVVLMRSSDCRTAPARPGTGVDADATEPPLDGLPCPAAHYLLIIKASKEPLPPKNAKRFQDHWWYACRIASVTR